MVYLALGLLPALALACEEAPVDGSTASSSAELAPPAAPESGAILATGGGHHAGQGYGAKDRVERLFRHFDEDGDGKIALSDLPDRLRNRLLRADTNKDGQVTRDEVTLAWKNAATEMRRKFDTNGDGVISDEERAKARSALWDKRFSEFDQDKDGALTASEVPARMWDHIKVADANGDAKITRLEIDSALASGKLGTMHRGRWRHHEDVRDSK